MYIIVEISKKWESISRNWGVRTGLLNVFSEPMWQFEKRYVPETMSIIRCN
jgi:hypothetical protein